MGRELLLAGPFWSFQLFQRSQQILDFLAFPLKICKEKKVDLDVFLSGMLTCDVRLNGEMRGPRDVHTPHQPRQSPAHTRQCVHQLVVLAEHDAQHAEEVLAEFGGDLLLQPESMRVSFCWDGQRGNVRDGTAMLAGEAW